MVGHDVPPQSASATPGSPSRDVGPRPLTAAQFRVLVGLFVLSFGMLPAVMIPGPVQDQMRNLIEVGLLGMAALLAARAFFDEKASISELILPWAAFLVAWFLRSTSQSRR